MREILFRGKRVDNGKWVKGYLTKSHRPNRYHSCWCIEVEEVLMQYRQGTEYTMQPYEVIPESVSEFTGLTDKNGNKIFEGDIVCFHGELYSEIFSIVFADGCFRLGTKNGYSYTLHNLHSALKVIGNIHDNPELLKGGVQE